MNGFESFDFENNPSFRSYLEKRNPRPEEMNAVKMQWYRDNVGAAANK
jgi:hypothetical protein